MKLPWSRYLTPYASWAVAAALLALLTWSARYLDDNLRRAGVFTGWFLFGVLALLAAFNSRKRLSMLPLGRASTWLLLHAVGGIVALPLFWLHTGTLWPFGLYERALTLLFYLITITGVAGWLLQKYYPRLLTATGGEIIYEQIPAAIAGVREQAEAAVVSCTNETGSPTLARHYTETMEWFFRRPRFFLNHILGGEKGSAWHRRHCATVERYLNEKERTFLEQVSRFAEFKTQLDLHFAVQSVMKIWLLIHLPLATAILALVIWHVILVHVYLL